MKIFIFYYSFRNFDNKTSRLLIRNLNIKIDDENNIFTFTLKRRAMTQSRQTKNFDIAFASLEMKKHLKKSVNKSNILQSFM
jgi:hypothetical protein